MEHTRTCCASRSLLLSSFDRFSFSMARSGYFSSFVLLRRFTIGFSRFSTCIRFTCVVVNDFRSTFHREKSSNLSLIFETNLSHCHAAVLLQVRPWRVHDSDVIFLVPCGSVSPPYNSKRKETGNINRSPHSCQTHPRCCWPWSTAHSRRVDPRLCSPNPVLPATAHRCAPTTDCPRETTHPLPTHT